MEAVKHLIDVNVKKEVDRDVFEFVVCLLIHSRKTDLYTNLHPKINWSSKATQAIGGQLELEPLWPLQPSRRGLLTPPVGPDGVELHLSNGLAKVHRPGRTQQASIGPARLSQLTWPIVHQRSLTALSH